MSTYDLDLGYIYKSIKNRSNSLSQVEAKAAQQGNQYGNFGADLFNGLFQSNPQLKATDPNLYTETLQAVQNSESFQKIKRQTQGNVNWSAIGASILLDELTSKVNYRNEPPPEEPKGGEPNDEPNEGDKDEQEQDKSDKGEDSKGEPNEDGEPDEDEDSEDGEGNSGEPNEDEDEPALDEGEDGEGNEGEPNREPIPVSQAIQDAVDSAAEKLGEMLVGLKAGTAGGLSTSDLPMVDGFSELARNPSLVQILRRIGRLKLNSSFLSALQVGGPEETFGVTWGSDLQHVMPVELAGLAGSDDEFMVFVDRFNRNALLQKQYKSNTKPGKGPMIVCVDTSGSMSGERIRWAQTIAAAMYLLAVKEKRAYALVPFTGRAYPLEPLDQKKLDPMFLNRIVSMNAGGGTNYDAAWTASVSFMDKIKRGAWLHADIVFITDGECGFDQDKWLKDKAKFGVRLFSFMLGMDESAVAGKWTLSEIANLYKVPEKFVLDNYKDMIDKPKNADYTRLSDTSDAVVFIPKYDDESVANSFTLVKNASQKKGQMVTKA